MRLDRLRDPGARRTAARHSLTLVMARIAEAQTLPKGLMQAAALDEALEEVALLQHQAANTMTPEEAVLATLLLAATESWEPIPLRFEILLAAHGWIEPGSPATLTRKGKKLVEDLNRL